MRHSPVFNHRSNSHEGTCIIYGTPMGLLVTKRYIDKRALTLELCCDIKQVRNLLFGYDGKVRFNLKYSFGIY